MIYFNKERCCTSKCVSSWEGQFRCFTHQKSAKNPTMNVPLLWLTHQRVLMACILNKNAISVCQCWHVTEDSPFSQQCIKPVFISIFSSHFPFCSLCFPHFVPLLSFFPKQFFFLFFRQDLVNWSWFSCLRVTSYKCEVCHKGYWFRWICSICKTSFLTKTWPVQIPDWNFKNTKIRKYRDNFGTPQ